ncbi:hypothetical protein GCM10009601_41150 [Streptomyces thermospinosisporus]|uniref:Uncharacterized protein n=1 Tax=Streptomyces thermospinosisporus TaxID=161482 RepID=A0ABP4JT44_9ACTN
MRWGSLPRERSRAWGNRQPTTTPQMRVPDPATRGKIRKTGPGRGSPLNGGRGSRSFTSADRVSPADRTGPRRRHSPESARLHARTAGPGPMM